MLSDMSMQWLRRLATLGALGIFVYYIAITWRWAVVWDSAVMHYIIFLIGKGFRPYAQILDLNMPGTYIAEQMGMTVFGWSDLSWRMYEFFLLAVMAVSGMVIGGKRNWLAGVFAAAFFIAMHGADGPNTSTERDELMTMLLVSATAMIVLAARRRMPLFMLPFGLLAGFAASVKPTCALLDVALVVLLILKCSRRAESPWRYVLWAFAGNAIIGVAVIGYLWHYHALVPFVVLLRTVLPAYAQSTAHDFGYMLENLFPEHLVWVMPFGVAAFLLRKQRGSFEGWVLLCGAAVGAISYFVQRKGYDYHRYMFVELLLLWIGLELADAMRREDKWSRAIGAAGIAAMFLLVIPHYVWGMARDDKFNYRASGPGLPEGLELTVWLEKDLQHLGGDGLQGQVLCLDLVSGCLNSLYRLRLVENMPYTGDLLLFAPVETPVVKGVRDQMLVQQSIHPADVIVLGNEWFWNSGVNFGKVDLWPEFAAELRQNYVPVVQRQVEGGTGAPAYRLYLRKGSDVLAREEKYPF